MNEARRCSNPIMFVAVQVGYHDLFDAVYVALCHPLCQLPAAVS